MNKEQTRLLIKALLEHILMCFVIDPEVETEAQAEMVREHLRQTIKLYETNAWESLPSAGSAWSPAWHSSSLDAAYQASQCGRKSNKHAVELISDRFEKVVSRAVFSAKFHDIESLGAAAGSKWEAESNVRDLIQALKLKAISEGEGKSDSRGE